MRPATILGLWPGQGRCRVDTDDGRVRRQALPWSSAPRRDGRRCTGGSPSLVTGPLWRARHARHSRAARAQHLSLAPITELRRHERDVMVRFGFAILRCEVLNIDEVRDLLVPL